MSVWGTPKEFVERIVGDGQPTARVEVSNTMGDMIEAYRNRVLEEVARAFEMAVFDGNLDPFVATDAAEFTRRMKR